MPEDENPAEKKDTIKKDLIAELRNLTRDAATRQRVEEGLLGEAEGIRGSLLAAMLKCFSSLETRLDSDFAKTRNVAALEETFASLQTELRGELATIKSTQKEFQIRVIETIERNLERQNDKIDSIPLPLVRAIAEIPKTLEADIGAIKATAENAAKDFAQVGKLNDELKASIAEIQKAVKEFNEGMRQMHDSLDLQKSRTDELYQMVQNKVDKLSVSLDEKAGLINEKSVSIDEKTNQLAMKTGAFEASLLTMGASIGLLEAKIPEFERKLTENRERIAEKISALDERLRESREEDKAATIENTKKLEMLAATILGIEALSEFTKGTEKKLDAMKLDITEIGSSVDEIGLRLDGISGTGFESAASDLKNTVGELQRKLDIQSGQKLDLAEVQASVDNLRTAMEHLVVRYDKSFKDIFMMVNVLQRTIEMRMP